MLTFHLAKEEHLENQLPPLVTVIPEKKWTFLQLGTKRESQPTGQSLVLNKCSCMGNAPQGPEFSHPVVLCLLPQDWEPPRWEWDAPR